MTHKNELIILVLKAASKSQRIHRVEYKINDEQKVMDIGPFIDSQDFMKALIEQSDDQKELLQAANDSN